MFSLIKLEKSDGLSQVEDFIGHRPDILYTHIQYTDGQTYIGEIGQPPEYFTASGWFKYLADHISEFKFVDMYAVDRLVKIPMVLQIKPISIEDLQLEIKSLKEMIAILPQPDILIESHIYPSWDTYEQFKQLANYKYFDAAENRDHDFIRVTFNAHPATALREKYNGSTVIVGHWIYSNGHIIGSTNPAIIIADKIECTTHIMYSGYGSCNQFGIEKVELLNSADYSYYIKCHHWDGSGLHKPFINLFHKSIKTYSIGYKVPFPIYQYALNYLLGWFLVNWYENIGHEIYLTVDITDIARFNIYKKQKKIIKYMDPCMVLILPTLRSVTINNVEYC